MARNSTVDKQIQKDVFEIIENAQKMLIHKATPEEVLEEVLVLLNHVHVDLVKLQKR